MIKAVIFDIDGTIIDTSEFIIQAYEFVIKKHKYPTRTREEIASQIGKKIEDCYAFLTPGADYARLIKDHDDFQNANLSLVRAFEHVNEVLNQLKTRRIKIGLWTGRAHRVIESLEKVGLSVDLIDSIVDATMHKKGKPNPEGFFMVCQLLETRPESTIMVGDSPLDIQAAKNAGAAVSIGITHGFGTKEALEAVGADYLVNNLKESLQTVEDLMLDNN